MELGAEDLTHVKGLCHWQCCPGTAQLGALSPFPGFSLMGFLGQGRSGDPCTCRRDDGMELGGEVKGHDRPLPAHPCILTAVADQGALLAAPLTLERNHAAGSGS